MLHHHVRRGNEWIDEAPPFPCDDRPPSARPLFCRQKGMPWAAIHRLVTLHAIYYHLRYPATCPLPHLLATTLHGRLETTLHDWRVFFFTTMTIARQHQPAPAPLRHRHIFCLRLLLAPLLPLPQTHAICCPVTKTLSCPSAVPVAPSPSPSSPHPPHACCPTLPLPLALALSHHGRQAQIRLAASF